MHKEVIKNICKHTKNVINLYKVNFCYFTVSVSQLAWYDEDKRFAVGYSDGSVYLCSKSEFEPPIPIRAHQVHLKCVTYDVNSMSHYNSTTTDFVELNFV